jgi:hypothetical protein
MSRMLLASLFTMSMERVNTSETHASSVTENRILRTVSAGLLVGISYYVGHGSALYGPPPVSQFRLFGLPTPFSWPHYC